METPHEVPAGSDPVLTLDHFSALVGATFTIPHTNGALALELAEAQPLPQSMREGGGFRLMFLGHADVSLAQGTYAFGHNGGIVHEIFVVPIGPASDGRLRYEAIFF